MYLLWPQNGQGAGTPVAINQADAWWVGFDRVSAGETFSVYGRNLTLGGGTCHLYIDGYGWISSDSANPYKADFTVPANLANGTYTVYAHNGTGREYGFSQALSLTVESAYAWKSNVYDVTSYGANGGDLNPDDAAIAAASAAAANNPGSTVYLPAGTYYLTGFMLLKGNTKYVGAGMGQTIITAAASGRTSSMLLAGGGHNIVLKGVSLRINNQVTNGRPVSFETRDNVVLENVEITDEDNTGTARTVLAMHETEYMHLKGCKFVVANDIYVGNAYQARFENCTFLGIRDCNQLMAVKRAKYLDMSNCSAGNLDESDITDGFGWCKGRWVTGTGPSSFCYFGGNTSENMMPRLDPNIGRWDPGQPDQNSGEQIMFEGLAVRYRGTATGVSPSSVTISGITDASGPRGITVVAGRGQGQSRIIESIDEASGVVTLASPWKVLPDTGSIFSIGNYMHHTVAYGNHLDGRPRAATEPLTGEQTASAGFQAYGGAFDLVVSDNRFSELKNGVYNWSIADSDISPDYDTAPPNYFNLFQNNVADYCYNGFAERFMSANKVHGKPLNGSEPGLLGNVYRNNVSSNMVNAGYALITDYTPGYITMEVLDQNRAFDSANVLLCSPAEIESEQVWIEASSEAVEPPPPGPPPSAVLTDISISGPLSVDEGTTAQYSCTATWSDGTTQTAAASWSENFANAGIDGSGLFSAGDVSADETATITASFDGLTDSLAVTINYIAPVLTGLEITGPASLDEGASAQYSCTATWSDGTVETVAASWSENSAYAAITAAGLLSAGDVDADQNVTLTASFSGLDATKPVTISYVAPVLTAIAIAGPGSIDEESTAQYFCTATWSDGTTLSIEPSWSVSAPASISASGVLTSGDLSGDQSVTVTASFAGQTDSHAVLINDISPALTGIAITAPAELEENATAQLVCTASYADGSTKEITPSWSISSACAVINSAGILSAGNIETNEVLSVTATFEDKTSATDMTIVAVGTQVVFPLSGFEGGTVRAELWDQTTLEWRSLGESVGPDELVVADIDSDRWYWLSIEQYDAGIGDWVEVHANWISM